MLADVWVVLDDVQLNARDYQHRMRLASLTDSAAQTWLTLPVHRPRGRASLIREVTLAEPVVSACRLWRLPRQHWGDSCYRPQMVGLIGAVAPLVAAGAPLAEVSEASTTVILRAYGWRGQIVRNSALDVRSGRCERWVDLTAAVGAAEGRHRWCPLP